MHTLTIVEPFEGQLSDVTMNRTIQVTCINIKAFAVSTDTKGKDDYALAGLDNSILVKVINPDI